MHYSKDTPSASHAPVDTGFSSTPSERATMPNERGRWFHEKRSVNGDKECSGKRWRVNIKFR